MKMDSELWKETSFPWIEPVVRDFNECYFSDYPTNTLQFIHKSIDTEVDSVYFAFCKNQNFVQTRAESVYKMLIYFYDHLCWKISQQAACPNVETSSIKLLSQIIKIGLVLRKTAPKSEWINRILTAIRRFPGNPALKFDALLLVNTLRTTLHKAYAIILEHILTKEDLECIQDPLEYIKVMLLFRRLKTLSSNRFTKICVIKSAVKIKPPSNLLPWLTHFIGKEVNSLKHTTVSKQLMGNKLHMPLLKKMCTIALGCYNVGLDGSLNKSCQSSATEPPELFFIDSSVNHIAVRKIGESSNLELTSEHFEQSSSKSDSNIRKKKDKRNKSLQSSCEPKQSTSYINSYSNLVAEKSSSETAFSNSISMEVLDGPYRPGITSHSATKQIRTQNSKIPSSSPLVTNLKEIEVVTISDSDSTAEIQAIKIVSSKSAENDLGVNKKRGSNSKKNKNKGNISLSGNEICTEKSVFQSSNVLSLTEASALTKDKSDSCVTESKPPPEEGELFYIDVVPKEMDLDSDLNEKHSVCEKKRKAYVDFLSEYDSKLKKKMKMLTNNFQPPLPDIISNFLDDPLLEKQSCSENFEAANERMRGQSEMSEIASGKVPAENSVSAVDIDLKKYAPGDQSQSSSVLGIDACSCATSDSNLELTTSVTSNGENLRAGLTKSKIVCDTDENNVMECDLKTIDHENDLHRVPDSKNMPEDEQILFSVFQKCPSWPLKSGVQSPLSQPKTNSKNNTLTRPADDSEFLPEKLNLDSRISTAMTSDSLPLHDDSKVYADSGKLLDISASKSGSLKRKFEDVSSETTEEIPLAPEETSYTLSSKSICEDDKEVMKSGEAIEIEVEESQKHGSSCNSSELSNSHSCVNISNDNSKAFSTDGSSLCSSRTVNIQNFALPENNVCKNSFPALNEVSMDSSPKSLENSKNMSCMSEKPDLPVEDSNISQTILSCRTNKAPSSPSKAKSCLATKKPLLLSLPSDASEKPVELLEMTNKDNSVQLPSSLFSIDCLPEAALKSCPNETAQSGLGLGIQAVQESPGSSNKSGLNELPELASPLLKERENGNESVKTALETLLLSVIADKENPDLNKINLAVEECSSIYIGCQSNSNDSTVALSKSNPSPTKTNECESSQLSSNDQCQQLSEDNPSMTYDEYIAIIKAECLTEGDDPENTTNNKKNVMNNVNKMSEALGAEEKISLSTDNALLHEKSDCLQKVRSDDGNVKNSPSKLGKLKRFCLAQQNHNSDKNVIETKSEFTRVTRSFSKNLIDGPSVFSQVNQFPFSCEKENYLSFADISSKTKDSGACSKLPPVIEDFAIASTIVFGCYNRKDKINANMVAILRDDSSSHCNDMSDDGRSRDISSDESECKSHCDPDGTEINDDIESESKENKLQSNPSSSESIESSFLQNVENNSKPCKLMSNEDESSVVCEDKNSLSSDLGPKSGIPTRKSLRLTNKSVTKVTTCSEDPLVDTNGVKSPKASTTTEVNENSSEATSNDNNNFKEADKIYPICLVERLDIEQCSSETSPEKSLSKKGKIKDTSLGKTSRYCLRHQKRKQQSDESSKLGLDMSTLYLDSPNRRKSQKRYTRMDEKLLDKMPILKSSLPDSIGDDSSSKGELSSSSVNPSEENTSCYNLRNRKSVLAPSKLKL